jgi:hypothetical protein
VAAAGAFVPNPAAGGNFDSFAQALVSFLFRHLTKSFKIIYLKPPKDLPLCAHGNPEAKWGPKI